MQAAGFPVTSGMASWSIIIIIWHWDTSDPLAEGPSQGISLPPLMSAETLGIRAAAAAQAAAGGGPAAPLLRWEATVAGVPLTAQGLRDCAAALRTAADARAAFSELQCLRPAKAPASSLQM